MLKSKEPAIRPDFNTVPEAMASLPAWSLWSAERRDLGGGNVEYSKVAKAIGGGNARSNHPEDWHTLAEVQGAYDPQRHAGVMFLLTNNPLHLCVMDVDPEPGHTLLDVLAAAPFLKPLMDAAAGSAETSPSGNGLHFWFIADRPADLPNKNAVADKNGEKVGLVEFYGSGDTRYMSFTGHNKAGTFAAPQNVSETFQKSVQPFTNRHSKTAQNASTSLTEATNPYHLTVDEVLAAATRSKSGETIKKLLAADPALLDSYPGEPGPGHQSGGEQALMNYLAFFSGKDPHIMDEIYRNSQLYRSKWDEKHRADGRTYGQSTIDKAIQGQRDICRPKQQQAAGQAAAPSVDHDKVERIKQQVAQLNTEKTTIDQIPEEWLPFIDPKTKSQLYENTTPLKQLDAFFDKVTANTPATPTGFNRLDNELDGGLYEGLYVVGAISSLGKTTLLLQIADQIAAGGHDVLVFSLEMSRYEIMAKTLSRLTYTLNKAEGKSDKFAKTVRGITDQRRYMGYTDIYGKEYPPYTKYENKLIGTATAAYKEFAGHVFIHEGVGNIGVEQLKEIVQAHEQATGNRPVIIVDYLQILAPYDIHATDKQNTDKAVLELKRLSRDHHIPVLAISSFNRENYSKGVSMVSFKESGAIEYSSDVLIGLQFTAQKKVDEANANRANNEPIHVLDMDAEKAKEPREVDLKILKNRNGKTGGSVSFNYFARFNDYEERSHLQEVKDEFITTDYSQLKKNTKYV